MPKARKRAPAPKSVRPGNTRQRLIDAAIDIVSDAGPAALTTAAIAAKVGIRQPGFYGHFKSVDECLNEGAKQLSAYLVDTDAQMRHQGVVGVAMPDMKEAVIERTKIVMRLWMKHPRFAILMARGRFDSTPFGEVCRESTKRATRGLVEDLWDLTNRFHVRGFRLSDLEIMASLMVAIFGGGLEMLATGAAPDLDAVATQVALAQHHYVDREFRRMAKAYREQRAAKSGAKA